MRGETVLLVAQPFSRIHAASRLMVDVRKVQGDARENGLWRYGGGAAARGEEPFQGMLVRVARGTVATGWLYVCTLSSATGAVFMPVYGPPPSKAQVDALEVDAGSVGGAVVADLQRKALVGGAVGEPGDMVIAGDPASADPYRVRGLRAGSEVRLVADPTGEAVRIHAGTQGTVCALRLADIIATGGQFVLRTHLFLRIHAVSTAGVDARKYQGHIPTMPVGWPAEWATLERPLLVYEASATALSGDVVFLTHDLPVGDGGFALVFSPTRSVSRGDCVDV